QLGQVLEAAYHVAQVVHQGGVVAILSTASGTIPAGADMISSAESVVAGLTQVRRHKEIDSLPWWHLAHALEQARVYVSSHFPAEVLESLFIIPMDQPSQVQQLINQAKSIVVVEGLDRTLLEVSRS
ncbi:MAG TPA: hypothetical protein PKA06_07125, partial [Gemmatales bacterium]|nr:hypothetical protein [Gemmatales bacterium]